LWYEDRFVDDLLYLPLKKIYKQTYVSPLNTKKYNVYFKRYVQTCAKEIVRLYTSMKEFRLVEGM
jgi:hypothetical protein